MKIKLVLIVITTCLFASCALTPPVSIEGRSFASPQIKRFLTNKILETTISKGCSNIEKIETSVTKEPTGEPKYEVSTELWRAFGCNKQFVFKVVFQGNGMDDAFLAIALIE